MNNHDVPDPKTAREVCFDSEELARLLDSGHALNYAGESDAVGLGVNPSCIKERHEDVNIPADDKPSASIPELPQDVTLEQQEGLAMLLRPAQIPKESTEIRLRAAACAKPLHSAATALVETRQSSLYRSKASSNEVLCCL
jgi:hypothetical protein